MSHQTILVLDFGSQYTQLIARRLRELSIYSEILTPTTPAAEIQRRVFGIYAKPNGALGDAMAERQAEFEPQTSKRFSSLPLNRRSSAEPCSAERSRTRVRSES